MRSVATATSADVAQVAASVFPSGNAVDAVIAGVFAAAALHPSVLLGPVQLLIAGAGVGFRAIDGRNRQPGLGLPRPRGFRSQDPIPMAAYFGVPGLPAALAATLATSGTVTLNKAIGFGLDLASTNAERKRFLKRLGQRGPSYLADDAVASELIEAGGRLAGGILSREDLEGALPAIVPCSPHRGLGGTFVSVPWGASALRGESDGDEAPVDAAEVHMVAAADHRGIIAIACYEVSATGVAIEPLGLEAPRSAAPVLRGETRTRPGELIRAAAPIALACIDETVSAAVGLVGVGNAEALLATLLRNGSGGESLSESIRAARSNQGRARSEAGFFEGHAGRVLGVERAPHSLLLLSDP